MYPLIFSGIFGAQRIEKNIVSLPLPRPSPLVPFQEVVIVVLRLLHAKEDDGLLGKEGGEDFGRERGIESCRDD